MKLCLACGGRFESLGWRCPSCGQVPREEDGIPVFAPELAAGDGSDADYAFDALLEAEGWHFWLQGRSRLVVWALRRHFPNARRFLEVGCGTGFVLSSLRAALPELSLSASDALSEGLSRARRRLPDVAFFQMDVRRIPFEEEFDAVGAFDVIEHVEEDEAVLRSLSRALRPGGGMLLTVPQHPFLWSVVDDFSRHKRRYTRRELVAKVERAALQVVQVTSFCSFLLPMLLLSRLRRRGQTVEAFDPASELRIHPAVNAVCQRVFDVERRLIGYGLSFPAGGSLLLAARRP